MAIMEDQTEIYFLVLYFRCFQKWKRKTSKQIIQFQTYIVFIIKQRVKVDSFTIREGFISFSEVN